MTPTYLIRRKKQKKVNNLFSFAKTCFVMLGILTSITLIKPNTLQAAVLNSIPAPTTLSPLNGNLTHNSQLYITGVTHNDTLVDVYIDGTYNGRAEVINDISGTAHWSYKPFLALKYGEHTIYTVARSQDEKNRSQESFYKTFTVAPHMEAPIVSLEHNSLNWQRPNILGITDEYTDLNIYIDGQIVKTFEFKKENLTDSTKIKFRLETPENLNPGWHQISAESVNILSNQSKRTDVILGVHIGDAKTPSEINWLIGSQAKSGGQPIAPTLLKPLSGSVNKSDTPIIGLAHNDQEVQFFIDGKLDGSINVSNHESKVTNFAYKPSQELSPGVHLVYTKAMDQDSKQSEASNTLAFLVEPTPKTSYDLNEFALITPRKQTHSTVLIKEETPNTKLSNKKITNILTANIQQKKSEKQLNKLATKSNIQKSEKQIEKKIPPKSVEKSNAEHDTDIEEIINTDDSSLDTTNTSSTIPITNTKNTPSDSNIIIIILSVVAIVVIGAISWVTTKPEKNEEIKTTESNTTDKLSNEPNIYDETFSTKESTSSEIPKTETKEVFQNNESFTPNTDKSIPPPPIART